MTQTHPLSSVLPHPRFRLPIIGDILTMDFAKPIQHLADEVDAHGGIVEQRIFDLSIVTLAYPALIDEVNDESRWEKYVARAVQKLRATGGDGLFTADNDEPNWRKAQ